MTRNVLCALLAAGSILLGLATALVQADNRDRGAKQNETMERSRMLEGVTRDRATEILGLDWGPLGPDPTILQRAKPSRPTTALPTAQVVTPKGAQP
jgi:hypothetical protein